MIKAIRRVLAGLRWLCGLLAILSLAGIALVILAGALGRLVGILVPVTTIISGMLLGMTIFLGLAPTFSADGHIRVELIIGRMHGRLRHGFELFCLIVALILVAIVTYACFFEIFSAYRLNTLSIGLLAIPVWIPQSSMLFGMAVLLLSLIEALLCTARRTAKNMAAEQHADNPLIDNQIAGQ